MSNLIISSNNNRKAWRDQKIQAGFTWNGNTFQSTAADQALIAGRATKLTTLLTLGRVQLTDSSYIDESGDTRPLVWRSLDNINVSFTVQDFLDFAIAMDEFIEDMYQAAWPQVIAQPLDEQPV